MLTSKQRELLLFIHGRITETGVSPSFDEMKDALNLASKSGIHRLITALEERGFIRRLPNRARALEVLKLPEAAIPGGRIHGVAPLGETVRRPGGDVGPPPGAMFAGSGLARGFGEGARMVEVLGKIAAGTPVEAIQTPIDQIAAPAGIVGSDGEYFALEVRGESMIEAGILEGDVVILKRVDRANSGDIVVALVDGQEATLKRLRRKGDTVALEAANPAFETRIFSADRVTIQGRLAGLIRRY